MSIPTRELVTKAGRTLSFTAFGFGTAHIGNMRRALSKNAGYGAAPRTDLKDSLLGAIAERGDDAFNRSLVMKKVLAELRLGGHGYN